MCVLLDFCACAQLCGAMVMCMKVARCAGLGLMNIRQCSRINIKPGLVAGTLHECASCPKFPAVG